jgi:putative DNA primase/helicase
MHGTIDFKSIASAALACARSLLPELVPGGMFDGDEYVALNPSRGDKSPGSFKINSRDGMWSDFATGATGNDVISWYAHACGLSQGKAARHIAEKLGTSTWKTNNSKGDSTNPPPKIFTYGEEGPPIEHNELRRHYYPKNGTPKKKVKIKKRGVPKHRQWRNCYRVFRNGEPIGWQWEKPTNYRLVPYADVGTDIQKFFWPEGEKDTDTLNKVGFTAFTFGGGDGLPDDIDEYLKHILNDERTLIIPIDNDEGGRKQGQKKANRAHACGINHIRIFDLTTVWPGCPDGGDITDWFEKGGGTREKLIEIVDALPDWQPSASDDDTSTTDDDAGPTWECPDISLPRRSPW